MDKDSELESEIITRLRQAIADAEQRGYQRGVRETMGKIQSLVMPNTRSSASSSDAHTWGHDADADKGVAKDSVDMVQERKRAPKGLVRKVVKRALEAKPGLTPAEIEATAQDDFEKMIRASSYRSELRKGREAGLYREEGGKWFLVYEEKAEDSPSSAPSAFGITTERG